MGNLLSRNRSREDRIFGRTPDEVERIKSSLTLPEIGPSDRTGEYEEADAKSAQLELDKLFADKLTAKLGAGHVAVGNTVALYDPRAQQESDPFEPHQMSA